MIETIRADFEHVLEFVTGAAAYHRTADEAERGIFRLVLALGAQLLSLFFLIRSEASSREPFEHSDGSLVPYHRDTKRSYFSIFGKLRFARPYFYRKDLGGQVPLDAELSLDVHCYSDLLRELSEALGVHQAYHRSCEILEQLFGLSLSSRVVEANVMEDSSDVESSYAQKSAPPASEESSILVVQADGKGVPMVLGVPAAQSVRLGKGQKRGRKKETIVTSVYTIAASVRTPEEVVSSFFHPAEQEERSTSEARSTSETRPKPQNKQTFATLDGKEPALERLNQQVTARQGEHITHQVAPCDGCSALQERIHAQFPDFTLMLDFIHADEYLWDVANSLLGETSELRSEWMQEHTLLMLSSKTDQIINEFHQLAQLKTTSAAQRTQLLRAARYFERNRPYMDYATYLRNGWPIASGVIEGACRHLVKDRCELSGMRWTQQGAESLLQLRAVAENGDWQDYRTFRRKQRLQRLYGTLIPDNLEAMQSLETQATRMMEQDLNTRLPNTNTTKQELLLAA